MSLFDSELNVGNPYASCAGWAAVASTAGANEEDDGEAAAEGAASSSDSAIGWITFAFLGPLALVLSTCTRDIADEIWQICG